MESNLQEIRCQNVHEVVGIGFGPSNLSLAIAMQGRPILQNTLFLEQSPRFSWHAGMLLPGTTMQVSFLKDLVSLRDPQSPFTFVKYLHSKGRLSDFINLQSFFPTRIEFHDYLSWCAAYFEDKVHYRCQVTSIKLESSERHDVPLYRITAQVDGVSHYFLARSIVHSCGLEPVLPQGVKASERVFHSSKVLFGLKNASPRKGSHFVVIGAGQSAAEVIEYLFSQDPVCKVTLVLTRFGFTPADDSPFVNQIFDPESVDSFYDSSPEGRRRILQNHANTNYAAVEIDAIKRIYDNFYQDKVSGKERLKLRRCSTLTGISSEGDRLVVSIRSLATGARDVIDADYAICATGLRPRSPLALMSKDLAAATTLDASNMPIVDRFHRVTFRNKRLPPFFSVGTAEATLGLSDTLLSNMAIRSGKLVNAVTNALDASEEVDGDVVSQLF